MTQIVFFFYTPSSQTEKPKWKIGKKTMIQMNDYFEAISDSCLFEDRELLLGEVDSKTFTKKWLDKCPWFNDEDSVYKAEQMKRHVPTPFMFAHEFADEWTFYKADKKLFKARNKG